MAPQAKAEHVIENMAGCGRFQVILYVCVIVLIDVACTFATMLMAFGNYNPGWRCLDNATETTSSIPTTTTNGSNSSFTVLPIRPINDDDDSTGSLLPIADDYVIGSCHDYRKCNDVEFNPAVSTIVTEWGLVCDKSRIVSLIISMQMVGMLIGAYVGGQLSDSMGRKKTMCGSIVLCSVAQFISSLSSSWTMFLVMRPIIGASVVSMVNVISLYIPEFMTIRWRAVMIAVPVWTVGTTGVTFVAWFTEDWRKVEWVGCALTSTSLLPMLLWAPESLRWLEVNNKRKEFIAVSKKIISMNSESKTDDNTVNTLFEDPDFFTEHTGTKKAAGKKYNILDLFKKEYRKISLCIMFLQFSCSLQYYALSFGAKSFHGQFYLNLFLLSITPLPVTLCGIFAIKVLRRRHYVLLFLGLTVLAFVLSGVILLAGDDRAKDYGSTVFICLAKATLDASWSGLFAFNAELYPTVVRGVAMGLGIMSGRVGGIIAPYLIPDEESGLYIFMIIVTALTVACCGICYKLPETKGKVLKETFDVDADDREESNIIRFKEDGDDESKDEPTGNETIM